MLLDSGAWWDLGVPETSRAVETVRQRAGAERRRYYA
jgi:hypothetical protein